MKKLLLILCLLLLPTLLYAGGGMMLGIVGGGTPAGAPASTAWCTASATCSTPPAQCDILCEDFDGAVDCRDGYDPHNCWRTFNGVTVDGTGTLDFSTTASGTYPCSGTTSTYVVQTYVADSEESACFRWDAASAMTTGFLQYYLYLGADLTVANNSEWFTFMSVAGSAQDDSFKLLIYNDNGTLKFGVRYIRDAGSLTVFGSVTATLNAWYRVNANWASATNSLIIKINGTTIHTLSDWGTDSAHDPYYFYFGPCGYESSGTVDGTIQFDNMTIDDDTEPSACS